MNGIPPPLNLRPLGIKECVPQYLYNYIYLNVPLSLMRIQEYFFFIECIRVILVNIILMKFAEYSICVAYPYSSARVVDLRRSSVCFGNLLTNNIPACPSLPMG